jgi:hypothetical protein
LRILLTEEYFVGRRNFLRRVVDIDHSIFFQLSILKGDLDEVKNRFVLCPYGFGYDSFSKLFCRPKLFENPALGGGGDLCQGMGQLN